MAGDVLVLTTTLLLVAIQPSLLSPVNDYDQEFTFTCPYRELLSSFSGIHSNHHEDRKFDLSCSELPVFGDPSCYWTEYVNDYDQPVAFQCLYGYIAGMSSVHHNYYEDRRFKFYCCHAPGTIRDNCFDTDWLNNWDDPFSFDLPFGQIIYGMSSYHDNYYEDRRFKLKICRLRLG